MKELELTWFDVKGYMAHFRKFFSTTTSLSYIFPPRTTLMGLIAAMLGLERDSYYELFSPSNLLISVSVLTPIRVITQGINHLMVKDNPELNVRGLKKVNVRGARLLSVSERIQVTTEFVVGGFDPDNPLIYRVYVASLSGEVDRYIDQLKDGLSRGVSAYPISLGPAYALAWIDGYGSSLAREEESSGEFIKLFTPVSQDLVEEVSVEDGTSIYYEERVPREMSSNRITLSTIDYLVPVGSPVKVRLSKGAKYYMLDDGYSITPL